MSTTNSTFAYPDPARLRHKWQELSALNPRRFPSEIALELGVSEAELLSSKTGFGVTRLKPAWVDLLGSLSRLGAVKSITRNDYAVLEKVGVYPGFDHFGIHAMFVSEDIDLRITLAEWSFAFASVNDGQQTGRLSRSFQFYGKDGSAVHKIFLTSESSVAEFDRLVET